MTHDGPVDAPRSAGRRGPATGWERRLNRGARWITRRWLALLCAGLAVYVALPVLAPILAATGHARLSGWIYLLFRAACHQLPHHSWFLFGRQWTYTWAEVQPYTTAPLDREILAFHQPIRDAGLGYQLAICERDLGIWVAMLAMTLILALRRRPMPDPLPLRWYAAALIPLGLDGITQLFGWRTSTPLLRTATGALFGAATALLIIPYLDLGFRDVRAALDQADV